MATWNIELTIFITGANLGYAKYSLEVLADSQGEAVEIARAIADPYDCCYLEIDSVYQEGKNNEL